MAHPISRIRGRIIALWFAATIVAMLILLLVTPLISDLTPQAMRNERLNYAIFAPIFTIAVTLSLYLYLRPIADVEHALDIGSTPAPERVERARRIAFNAPIYFFVLPTVGVFFLALLSDVFGLLVLPDYVFANHFPNSLLITITTACGALIVSVLSQHWMRPVLLYTAAQSQGGGRRFNIRARLFAITLTLTLIAVLFTGLFSYNQAARAYRGQLASLALLQLSRAVESLPPNLEQDEVLDAVRDTLGGEVAYESIFLMEDDGQIRDQWTAGEAPLRFDARAWLQDRPNVFRHPRGDLVLAAVQVSGQRWWVGIGYQVHPLRSPQVVSTLATLSIFGAIMVLLVAVISYYLAASVVLDLRFLTARLLNIAHEERVDLTKPVPVLSLDEVGDLILAYNALQQRVRLQQGQIEREQGQLMALQSLSYKIGSIRDMDLLLREVIRDVERAFGYHRVSILLADSQQKELFVAATNHMDASVLDRRFRIGQEGIVGRVAGTGEPLLVNDVSSCDFFVPDGTPIRSEMAVPLTVADRIIGVFDVASDQKGAFDESNLRIVTALSNQVAIAIENVRLLHEAVTNAQELERRARNLMTLHHISTTLSTSLSINDVLTNAAQQLVTLFGVEHSTVFLLEAEKKYGEIAAEYPSLGIVGQTLQIEDFPAAQRVLTTRSPLLIADVGRSEFVGAVREVLKSLRIRSMLLIPLLSKGSMMGILSLDVIASQHTFAAEEVGICQTIAAQIAIAVENATLFENMRLQTDALARLADDVAAERAKLDAILQNLADGLLVTDPMGRILVVNPAFRSLFRLPQEDLQGEFITRVAPQAPLQQLVIETSIDKSVHAEEISLPDGRFIQATAAVVQEEDRVSNVVMVLRDITRERRLDQLKSDFISTVSHELRTPLTIVHGFADRIQKSYQKHIMPILSTQPQRGQRAMRRIAQNLDNMISGVKRLDDLVEDVLIVADIDAGRFVWHMGEVNTGLLLQSMIDAYREDAEAKGLRIQAAVPDDLPPLYGDAERLALVVENVLTNAIKFTDHGQIDIRAQAIYRQGEGWSPSPIVSVPDSLPESAYLVVSIRDTGPGISPEAQRTLFERFGQGMRDVLTDKPVGTGLGLAISQEIVTHHNGHIWVESEPGHGSTFSFVVPLFPGPEGASEGHVQVPDTAPSILVVDDQKSVRDLLQYILSNAGYRTMAAADGLTALNMARAHKPDLIVLDIMMPGINGLDVASVLKADRTTREIPIVILSAAADSEKAAQLGAEACLSKPVEEAALTQTLARLLKERQ
jgi:PAS domain S-box-containing protein